MNRSQQVEAALMALLEGKREPFIPSPADIERVLNALSPSGAGEEWVRQARDEARAMAEGSARFLTRDAVARIDSLLTLALAASPSGAGEERPLCGTCRDREGVVCDLCGNGIVPPDQRRVPFRSPSGVDPQPDLTQSELVELRRAARFALSRAPEPPGPWRDDLTQALRKLVSLSGGAGQQEKDR